jgi:hypothetical protein
MEELVVEEGADGRGVGGCVRSRSTSDCDSSLTESATDPPSQCPAVSDAEVFQPSTRRTLWVLAGPLALGGGVLVLVVESKVSPPI